MHNWKHPINWPAGKGPENLKSHHGENLPQGQHIDSHSDTVDMQTSELWLEAHRYAPANADNWEPMAAMRWYNAWADRIPRFGCGCQNHWSEMTRVHRPTFTSPKAFFEWFWARHDDVSRQHSGRPRITLDQAYALYWPDAVR